MVRRRAGRQSAAPYDSGLVGELKEHPLVQQATDIAAAFHQDPVAMLRGTWFEWQIRLAAAGIVADNLPKPPT